VSEEAYFILASFDLLVDLGTWEPMDDEYVLARVEGLNQEQAAVLQDTLAMEAAGMREKPSVWLESESESRKDPGRHLYRNIKAQEMQKVLSSSQFNSGDLLFSLAATALRYVEALMESGDKPSWNRDLRELHSRGGDLPHEATEAWTQ
jgi:hypothetical protein